MASALHRSPNVPPGQQPVDLDGPIVQGNQLARSPEGAVSHVPPKQAPVKHTRASYKKQLAETRRF